MLEVQNGTAILHGIRAGGGAITISGYATFIIETAKGQHKWELDTVKNEINFTVSLIATDPHIEVDLTFKPSGATRAAAQAVAAFLTPLAKVTLANFAVAAFNGDWLYAGDESIDLNQKQGKMSLKIRKYDDAAQNASLTTTVNG